MNEKAALSPPSRQSNGCQGAAEGYAKVTALRGPTGKPRSLVESPANETVGLSLRLSERLASLREPIGVSELAHLHRPWRATP